jgi:hypothetical protein
MNERSTTREAERARTTTGEADGGQIRKAGRAATGDESFLPSDRIDMFRDRWGDVQASFVDSPRAAVQEAQGLVGELVEEMTTTFTRERGMLEDEWKSGGEPNTEMMRVALQRYRAFFNRLLDM